MKKIALTIFLCTLILASCQRKQTPPGLGSYNYEQNDDNNNTRGGEQTDNPTNQRENIPQQIHDIWSYTPQSVNVPAQTTMEQVISNVYPNMLQCRNYENVGGPKFIGEMSADKAGYNNSYYPYPIILNVLSLSQLHLGFISSGDNIICQVIKGNVKIESANIISGYDGMKIDIVVRNISSSPQNVGVEQGQMIEVSEPHVQNVVISSITEAQIQPYGSRRFSLPIYCAAHHRNSPTGYPARLTPYALRAPSNTFQSQQRIWDIIESYDDPNSYVTFYVWGKGDVTGSGGRSLTGHAFVRIPHVGTVGFSSLHGDLLSDDGRIYDHASNIKYATDSCRIKVSPDAIKAMTSKLRQLQNDVPKYKIGRYDCTSFVMDIADAGNIHYGLRITIQSPVGFMQELKKYNYSY